MRQCPIRPLCRKCSPSVRVLTFLLLLQFPHFSLQFLAQRNLQPCITIRISKMARKDKSPRSSYNGSSTSSTSASLVSMPISHEVPGLTPDLEKVEAIQPRSTPSISRVQSAISTIRSRRPVPPFSHPLTYTKTGPDVIVGFDGPDDPYNPLNWPFKKKVITTVLYGFTTMGSTWASSVYSPAIGQVSEQFHVGTEVSSLGLSLLLFGFGVGPLLWAPLSEVYGRKPVVLGPYFIAAIFSFGTATAKDIQTVLITRFFTGLFGSAPVTNTGEYYPLEASNVHNQLLICV